MKSTLLLFVLLVPSAYAADFVVGIGDSRTAGYPNYTPFNMTTLVPASGNIEANYIYRLSVNSSGAFVGTNLGRSGDTLNGASTVASSEYAKLQSAKFFLLQCAINDIAGGGTFASTVPNLDAILGHARSVGANLAVQDVLPGGIATALAITNYNTALTNWIATNRYVVFFIPVHDAFTNPDGTLKAAYDNGDTTHLNVAGDDFLSLITWTNLLTIKAALATNSVQSVVTGNRRETGNRLQY